MLSRVRLDIITCGGFSSLARNFTRAAPNSSHARCLTSEPLLSVRVCLTEAVNLPATDRFLKVTILAAKVANASSSPLFAIEVVDYRGSGTDRTEIL